MQMNFMQQQQQQQQGQQGQQGQGGPSTAQGQSMGTTMPMGGGGLGSGTLGGATGATGGMGGAGGGGMGMLSTQTTSQPSAVRASIGKDTHALLSFSRGFLCVLCVVIRVVRLAVA